MANTHLSPPWIVMYREINELFRYDPEVTVDYCDEDHAITLYIDSQEKAVALAKLIPEEFNFGNVTMKLQIIPSNNKSTSNMVGDEKSDLFAFVFKNNPIVDMIISRELHGLSAC